MADTHLRYISREPSWLAFNQRVLDEARDPTLPLLERLRFLAITASNLDEFFMVRVGGLRELFEQGSTKPDPAGLTPEEQLAEITRRVREMTAEQYDCLLREVEPGLAEAGIRRVRPGETNERQARAAEHVFEHELYPILSPMAVDEADRFPLLAGRALCVCVRLEPAADGDGRPRFALIPLGRFPYRFVTLPSETRYAYMLVEDVVAAHVQRFFPGESVVECVPFRITRNADLGVREDLASDLLAEMQELLVARKEGACVRIEVAEEASSVVRGFLLAALETHADGLYPLPGPLDLSAFHHLADLPGADALRYEPWPPRPSPAIDPSVGVFETIRRRDVLLYHPYESFDPVVRWIEEAADDPDVLAIKQILYRTSRNSPIVAALLRAAERGKHVTVVVELKARFDEARNIEWARNLEQAGGHVVYGVKGLKTHAKCCLIVRREPHGIQRYVHFGTGNYNEITARLYTDASLMTADEDLGADATAFFNAITGYSQPQKFRKIEAAPLGLRERLLEMIEQETERKRHGQRARISAKLNSLVDPQIIDALYAASQAGVRIRLAVRGICCLRPGVKGLSENISVLSVVDRFLEHARILHFHHGGDDRVFLSSADWMPRNLDRRVELLVPVEDEECKRRLIDILRTGFADNAKARRLLPDGRYERIRPATGDPPVRCQESLWREACEAIRRLEQSRQTVLVPHRAEHAPP